MRTRYFARTVETADSRNRRSENFFRVAPKREQSLLEFVASIGPRWSHLASMAGRPCRRLTANGENYETE